VSADSNTTTPSNPFIPQIKLHIFGSRIPALLDTGSTLSFVSCNLIPSTQQLYPWDMGTIEMMDGSGCTPLGFTKIKFRLGMKIFKRNFVVLDSSDILVLGMDFLKTSKVVLDLDQGVLSFKNHPHLKFPIFFQPSSQHLGKNFSNYH